MSRKRFKQSRICSSENYEQSRKAHFNDLKCNHDNNQELLLAINISITIDIRIIKTPYIKVFGVLVPISKEEIGKVDPSFIIYL